MHFGPTVFCLIMRFSFVLFFCSVFQAEFFFLFPWGGFFWGIGYLPSATDRFIIHLSTFYFGFGMAGGPGMVFC